MTNHKRPAEAAQGAAPLSRIRVDECIFCGPDHPDGLRHSDAEIRAYERGRAEGAAPRAEGLARQAESLRMVPADTDYATGYNDALNDILEGVNASRPSDEREEATDVR